MDVQRALALLRKPFAPEHIEWKPQSFSKDGTSAAAVAFVDVRRYQDRLDEADPAWSARYEFLKDDGSMVMCYLTVAGVTRCDIGAKDEAGNNVETSTIAQAFKRAATAFGLGRDLYYLPMQWIPVDDRKRFTRSPMLADWYYQKCGLPIAGTTTTQATTTATTTADEDFAHLHQDDAATPAKAAVPTFAELIKDDTYRKEWWAEVKKLGYTEETIHTRLGVESLTAVDLAADVVWAKIAGWCPVHNVENQRKEKDGSVWYSHKVGDNAWCNGGKVKEAKKKES